MLAPRMLTEEAATSPPNPLELRRWCLLEVPEVAEVPNPSIPTQSLANSPSRVKMRAQPPLPEQERSWHTRKYQQLSTTRKVCEQPKHKAQAGRSCQIPLQYQHSVYELWISNGGEIPQSLSRRNRSMGIFIKTCTITA